jgi:hypothetical protein
MVMRPRGQVPKPDGPRVARVRRCAGKPAENEAKSNAPAIKPDSASAPRPLQASRAAMRHPERSTGMA